MILKNFLKIVSYVSMTLVEDVCQFSFRSLKLFLKFRGDGMGFGFYIYVHLLIEELFRRFKFAPSYVL